MNNRVINKSIAEFLGWKELDFHLDGKRVLGDRPTFSNGKIISYTVDQYVPDYCNDLNAMREVEMTLSNEIYEEYWNQLIFVCMNEGEERMNSASAKLRAKAFVITIGKWKE